MYNTFTPQIKGFLCATNMQSSRLLEYSNMKGSFKFDDTECVLYSITVFEWRHT